MFSSNKKKLSFFILYFILCVSSSHVLADVNLQTGAYHQKHQDVFSVDGSELTLTRDYRSNRAYLGWFGRGWGSTFETHLTFMPDAVVLQIGGHGKATWFHTDSEKKNQYAAQTATKIMRFMQEDKVEEPKLNQQYLLQHAPYRLEIWQQALRLGMSYTVQIPKKKKWATHSCACHHLTVMPWGYRHTVNGTLSHDFDRQGRLLRLWQKDQSSLKLSYAAAMIRIEDGDGHYLELVKDTDGRVTDIVSSDAQASHYVYGQRGLLLYSQNRRQENFNYWYNEQARLIAIGSPSFFTRETIVYDSHSKRVISTGNVERTQKEYHYRYQAMEPETRWTSEVVSQSSLGRKVIQKISFWFRSIEGGHEWLTRRSVLQNGITTETELTKSGLPLRIERQGRVTRFHYDTERELLIEKITPYATIKIKYDAVHHKISRVERQMHEGGAKRWSMFRYDDSGNLKYAENHLGKRVDLVYGSSGLEKGRIIEMIEDQQVMSFKYGVLGKPVHIEVKGVGGITVEYDDDGDISSVQSDRENDHAIALKVTQMFQSLLSLVKPAGVDLSM